MGDWINRGHVNLVPKVPLLPLHCSRETSLSPALGEGRDPGNKDEDILLSAVTRTSGKISKCSLVSTAAWEWYQVIYYISLCGLSPSGQNIKFNFVLLLICSSRWHHERILVPHRDKPRHKSKDQFSQRRGGEFCQNIFNARIRWTLIRLQTINIIEYWFAKAREKTEFPFNCIQRLVFF